MFPTVLSFILCDTIQRDAQEKLYLFGVFNAFNAAKFPAVFRNSRLYCALTGGRGEVSLTLRLTAAADLYAPAVITTVVPVTFRGPLDMAEVVLSFEALTFPAPGVFAWQIELGGEVFYERRLLVQQVGG